MESQSWPPRAPIPPLIPELHASNVPPITRQVNRTRSAARAYSLPNVDLMIGSVLKTDDYAVEFNGATLDLEQNRPERPAGIHTDSVVVRPTVYARLSEVLPTSPSVTVAVTIPLGV